MRVFKFFLLIFLFSFFFFSVNGGVSGNDNGLAKDSSGVEANIFVGTLYSNLSITPELLYIYVPPNDSTFLFFDLETSQGNIDTPVSYEIFNFANHTTFTPESFSLPKTTKLTFFKMDFDALNYSQGVFIENLTVFSLVNKSNVSDIPLKQDNATVIITVSDSNIGRLKINTFDDAFQVLNDVRLSVYQGIALREIGFSENGSYYSAYYFNNTYLLIRGSKQDYTQVSFAVNVKKFVEEVNLTLKGTSELEFDPEFLQVILHPSDGVTLITRLRNVGTGTEKDVSLTNNATWLQIVNSTLGDIPPNGFRDILINILPLGIEGIYGDKVIARGKRTTATFTVVVQVVSEVDPDSLPSGGGTGSGSGSGDAGDSGEGFEGSGSGVSFPGQDVFVTEDGVVIINPESFQGVQSDEGTQGGSGSGVEVLDFTELELESFKQKNIDVEIIHPESIEIITNIQKTFFVKVKNVGTTLLTNLELDLLSQDETVLFDVTYPDFYIYLLPGKEKTFIVKVLGFSEFSNNFILRFSSNELSSDRNIDISSVLKELDRSDLIQEYNSLVELLDSLEEELVDLEEQGYPVRNLLDYLDLIKVKLNTADKSIRLNVLYEARDWLDQVIFDTVFLQQLIDRVILGGKPVSLVGLVIMISIVLILILFVAYYYVNRESFNDYLKKVYEKRKVSFIKRWERIRSELK